MALYWYWSNVIGELVYKDGSKKRIYGGCGCNCLAVLASYGTDMDDPKPTWRVFGEFWNDAEHLEKMLGIRKGYQGKKNWYSEVAKVRINTFFKDDKATQWYTIVKAFAKIQVNIEFYHKTLKKARLYK